MSYTLIWTHAAVAGLIRLRAADPVARQDRPWRRRRTRGRSFPDTSTSLGSANQRRLRVGAARVIYTVSEDKVAVDILTVGRNQA